MPRRTTKGSTEPVSAWIAARCTHTKGEWAGGHLELADWQREVTDTLFGTLLPDGRRQYRTALIGVPRKNGKSTLAAAYALRLLFADREPGAEVYGAAADRDQAAIVFEMARRMVEAYAPMARIAKVYRRSIVVPRTGSTYKVLSADVATKHGLSPSAVIVDELHAQPNRELWDVLTTGQGARRQPLTIAITTAGHDKATICRELYDYGRKVESGVLVDPTFFFRWWGADEAADWRDEKVWASANPNLGRSVSLEFLRSEAKQAEALPARQNTFRRLYLNQWTQQHTRWLDLAAWDATAGMVDESKLAGRRCHGGIDLASTSDIAALCWSFPADGEQVESIWRFWLPEDRLSDLDARTAGRGSVWVREGRLRLTPGNVIDYTAIRAQIDRDMSTFDVVDVAYDPWGMTQLAQDLVDLGVTLVQHRQGFASMSPPTREFERRVLNGTYRHGGNPIMRWMVDNVTIRTDPAGNIKADKGKSADKIDGVVAGVMALDRLIRHEGGSAVEAVW